MDNLNEISLEGFKVVSGDYFVYPTRSQEPTMTVWYGSIGFSKQDINLLNNCENIRIHINLEEKKILIVPSISSDKDCQRWVKGINQIEARKFNCPKLTDALYETWQWDRDYIYKARGKLVTSANKVMLLFNFTYAEKWKCPEAKNGQ